MTFAGVSVLMGSKLLGSVTSPATVNCGAPSGYHLLLVEGHIEFLETKLVFSRSFTIGGHCWRILCYPNGLPDDDADFIGFRLVLDEQCTKPVRARFEFSFVDETEKQDPAHISASRSICEFNSFSSQGYDRFMRRDVLDKSRHLKEESFTIRCDVMVIKDVPAINDVPPSDMQRNFADLLLSGDGADVVFRVGGEIFQAHRCVLAARSSVFRAALFDPLKDGRSTVIQINDMDPTVFKALLGFIYSDSLPAPTEEENDDEGVVLLEHLLVASDRYGLQRLRAICEKKLFEHICVRTVATILALAEQHYCQGLKEACYEFLRCPANLKAAVDSDGFDNLCRSCPSIMKDVVLNMLQAPK